MNGGICNFTISNNIFRLRNLKTRAPNPQNTNPAFLWSLLSTMGASDGSSSCDTTTSAGAGDDANDEDIHDPNWASRRATELLKTHIPSQSSSSFSEQMMLQFSPSTAIHDNNNEQNHQVHQQQQQHSDDYMSAEEDEWEEDEEDPPSEWDRAVRTGQRTVARTTNDIFFSHMSPYGNSSPDRGPQQQQQHFLTPLVPSQSGVFTTSSSEMHADDEEWDDEEDDDEAYDRVELEALDESVENDASEDEDSMHDSASSSFDEGKVDMESKRRPQQQLDQKSSSNNKVLVHVVEPTSQPPRAQSTLSPLPSSTPRKPQQHFVFEDSGDATGDLSAGVLPDVLMTMRQKIESLSMFDSDLMRLANSQVPGEDPAAVEYREAIKRSSQQAISASALTKLAHKRYERRRFAAIEIEKVIRGLVALHQQTKKNELERVRAILLLLSDDYVRSTNEDARKGGVVALAACAIGLKKANEADGQGHIISECRDLIMASVIHACQDHSKRVRYYAVESLFNVVKGEEREPFHMCILLQSNLAVILFVSTTPVMPSLAVEHFFILYEVLRSLFAHVDPGTL